jgi:hypothetical protein
MSSRGRVDLAAAHSRIDEGAESHPGQHAGLPGGDLPVEVHDDALGEVVGFDLSLESKPLDAGSEAVVAADHSPEQPLVTEMIEPALLPVALASRVNEGQPSGRAGVQKAPLELEDELVRRAIATIAGGGDGVAVPNQGHRIRDR